MKWTPCEKTTCEYYNEAECKTVVLYGKRLRLQMTFSKRNSNFIGHNIVTNQNSIMYPCLQCKHYQPTKFDLFEGEEDVKESRDD